MAERHESMKTIKKSNGGCAESNQQQVGEIIETNQEIERKKLTHTDLDAIIAGDKDKQTDTVDDKGVGKEEKILFCSGKSCVQQMTVTPRRQQRNAMDNDMMKHNHQHGYDT